MAIEHAAAGAGWSGIRAWRKARRVELVAARVGFALEERKRWNERITALLEAGFPVWPGTVIGFCWPYRGEFDARFVIRRWRDQGAVAALPEVIEKARPLQFREWWPGVAMKPGVYDRSFLGSSVPMTNFSGWRVFTYTPMTARTTVTAVNIEMAMPRAMVTAKPRTGPDRTQNSRRVAISVVTLESTMVA